MPSVEVIADWSDSRRWSYGGAQYNWLDGIQIGDDEGTLVFKFRMRLWERACAAFTGRLYVSVMTFRQPLQPIRVDVAREPEFVDEWRRHWSNLDEATT